MSNESLVRRQFHLLSFEGPDLYAHAGGVATRVVGLAEALACTGTSGEEYARAGENALVIAREDPGEFIAQFEAVFARANRVQAMRRSGLRTAREYTWQRVLERHLLPCIGAFDGLARDALRVA